MSCRSGIPVPEDEPAAGRGRLPLNQRGEALTGVRRIVGGNRCPRLDRQHPRYLHRVTALPPPQSDGNLEVVSVRLGQRSAHHLVQLLQRTVGCCGSPHDQRSPGEDQVRDPIIKANQHFVLGRVKVDRPGQDLAGCIVE